MYVTRKIFEIADSYSEDIHKLISKQINLY